MYISYQILKCPKMYLITIVLGDFNMLSPQGATIMICNCAKFEYDTLSKACYKVLKANFS